MRHEEAVVGAAAAVLVFGAAVAAVASAAPPRDLKAPTRPTVIASRETTDPRPVFHFRANDDRTAPAQLRFRCAVDSNTLRPCSRIMRPPRALTFGQHVLRVRAVDRAGNLSSVAVYGFTVVGLWEAAADFARGAAARNPGRDAYGNTPWFYLYSGTTAHEPSDYRALPAFEVRDPFLELWYSVPGPFNHTGVWIGWSAGRITMHPGHPGLRQNAIIGWRSPVTTSIRLAATIEQNQIGCAVPQNGVVWSIDQGASTLRSGRLAPGEDVSVEMVTPVAAGEPLFLVVDANGDSNCDGTFVDLTLTTR